MKFVQLSQWWTLENVLAESILFNYNLTMMYLKVKGLKVRHLA